MFPLSRRPAPARHARRARTGHGGLIALVAALSLAACGGRYRSAQPVPADPGDAPHGVLAAALPFAIVDGRSGGAVATADFHGRLRAARAICAGELHPSPHDHWAQLQLLEQLTAAPAAPGLALGLEMVQQPFQAVLDDWSAGRIDDAALSSRTGWRARWGTDFELYRPLLEAARARAVPLIALNAASELSTRVADVGVDGLTASERALLPALDLADAQHRAWFDGVMAALGDAHGHGQSHGSGGRAAHGHAGARPHHAPARVRSPDTVYAAQVLWDEAMAERAARWLATADHRILILAGNGHCHDLAIARRLQRRGVTPVVTVRPLVDDGRGNVAAALAEGLHDFLFVMTPPGPPGPGHP